MGKGGSVSDQGGAVMPEDAPGNPGAARSAPQPARQVAVYRKVREMQAKLHRWAGEDPSRPALPHRARMVHHHTAQGQDGSSTARRTGRSVSGYAGPRTRMRSSPASSAPRLKQTHLHATSWLSWSERAGFAAPGTGCPGRCACRGTERPQASRGTEADCRIFQPAAARSRSFRTRRFPTG
jgi:hypothetical protein